MQTCCVLLDYDDRLIACLKDQKGDTERERERETDRQRDREKEKKDGGLGIEERFIDVRVEYYMT